MTILGLSSEEFAHEMNKRPYRLIQLYTYEGEVVLDPFMGSGQTGLAAIKTKRHYVGYDINEEYVKLAERRIRQFSCMQNVPASFESMVSEDKEEYGQVESWHKATNQKGRGTAVL